MQKSQRFNLVTHTGIKCVSNIKYKKSVQTFHFVQIFFIFYATFIRFIMMYILFFWGGGGDFFTSMTSVNPNSTLHATKHNLSDHDYTSVHLVTPLTKWRFMLFVPYIFWLFKFYPTNVHFYFILFNTYISLKMVQHVSNLIWGSSSGTSPLNYTSPSSKVHVRLYTIYCTKWLHSSCTFEEGLV
jgi:hypothetical protein